MMPSDRPCYPPVRGRRPLGDPLPPHATGISPIRWHRCLMSRYAASQASLSLPMKRAIVARQLQEQQAHILRQAALDAPLPERHTTGTLPGDSRKLRGIPAIGIGVAGHIPGTHPEQAACR